MYTTKLEFELLPNTLVITDETDYLVQNWPQDFHELTKKVRLISFTGTTTDQGFDGIDQMTLVNMNFHVIDYWPAFTERARKAVVDREVEL